MLKNKFLCTRRVTVFVLFVLVTLMINGTVLVSSTAHSWASDSIPYPAKKPDQQTQSSSLILASASSAIKGNIVQYSLKDFTKALLDYGRPPVPHKKPELVFKIEDINGPISEAEAEKYRQIFALQAKGKMDQASDIMATLKDYRLRGHVLFQRYMHPTAYTSSFSELQNWLELYADLPGADRVYALALKKKPAGYSGNIKKPIKSYGVAAVQEPTMVIARTYKSSRSRDAAEKQQVRALKKQIESYIRKDQLTKAVNALEDKQNATLLDTVEHDLLQSRIAEHYLYLGKIQQAYELSSKSAKRSGMQVPIAGWIAGLVAWGQGHPKEAAGYFEVMARSSYASSWQTSGGAYWAARAHMKAGNVKKVSTWLKRAADHPRTFYGLIATRALGRDFDFNWKVPTFSEQDLEVLEKIPAGARAMALVAAGQDHLAESELLRVRPKDDETRKAMIAYASYANLPALALRLGAAYQAPNGFYDAALYPKGNWKTANNYKIDPALIHAIMRQESKFDYTAKSPQGARGLMQLMPATAKQLAGRKTMAKDSLLDPETNLELGEKYLANLLDQRYVEGDLISLLIAYNAGPGNLARWKKRWGKVKDPLLFMELISAKETRGYVEKVLANYWIYRLREDLPTPTLDALAEGKTARYADAQNVTKEKNPYRLAFNR